MKIEDILEVKHCIYTSCPIASDELGHVYLNQTGIWNVTFNSTHADMIGKEAATVAQLLDIFQHASRCWKTVQDTFDAQLPRILKNLEALDPTETIPFR